MARIFISYARKDASDIADELADRLRALNHEVFLDIHGIPGGTEWEKQLIERAKWCDVLVVLITEASNQSRYVYDEFREAEKNKKLIIPVQVENSALPPHITHLNALPFKNKNYDGLLLKLEVALRNLQTSKSGLSVLQIAVPVVIILAIIAAVVVITQLGNKTDGDSETTAEAEIALNITEDTPTNTPEPPTATNTDVPTPIDSSTPTLTHTPRPTSTPRPPTSTPTFTPSPTDIPEELILFEEDFEDNISNYIDIWDATWRITTEGENNKVLTINGSMNLQFTKTMYRHNYILQFDTKFVDKPPGSGNFAIRYSNSASSFPCPGYEILMYGSLSSARIARTGSNCITGRQIANGGKAFNLNTWYTFSIVAFDDALIVLVDDSTFLQATIEDFNYNLAGITTYNWSAAEIRFDNIRVWSLDTED